MTHCHDYTCNNARVGAAYTPDQCRKCWAAIHVPAVAASLGRAATAAPVGKPCGCKGCPDCGGWLDIPDPPPVEIRPTSRRAVVTAAAGDEGATLHAASGPAQRAYAARLGADYVVLDWPGVPGWGVGVKLALYRALEHYDRVAWLDADALPRPGCADVFEACGEHEFGIVDELPWHRANPRFGLERSYAEFRARHGFASRPVPWYGNAGVMVIPRSHLEVIRPPARLWVGSGGISRHCAEQHWTNARLLDSGLPYRLLDRRCNWQSWTDHGFRAAPADAILHWSGAGAGRRTRAAEIAAAGRTDAPRDESPC